MNRNKGHVTRSLADGYARYSLLDIADKAKAVRKELSKEVKKHATLPVRRAGSKRVIARFHKKLYPLSLATCDIASSTSMMGGWVLPSVEDKQLVATTLLLGVGKGGTLAIDSATSMVVTAHALGRLWQRTELEDLKWEVLRQTLGLPLIFSWAMRKAAGELGFQRLALPCMDGLLVGTVDEGQLVLTTYLEPPLANKWAKVREAFDNMLLQFTEVAQADEESKHQVTRMYKAGCVGLNVPEVQVLLLSVMKAFNTAEFQWMKLVYNGEAVQ